MAKSKPRPSFNVYGKTNAKPVSTTGQLKPRKDSSKQAKDALNLLLTIASVTPVGRGAKAAVGISRGVIAQFNKNEKMIKSLRQQYRKAKTAEQRKVIAEKGKSLTAQNKELYKEITNKPRPIKATSAQPKSANKTSRKPAKKTKPEPQGVDLRGTSLEGVRSPVVRGRPGARELTDREVAREQAAMMARRRRGNVRERAQDRRSTPERINARRIRSQRIQARRSGGK